MTRCLTGDIPGWAALFDGKVGDGTVTVSETKIFQPFTTDKLWGMLASGSKHEIKELKFGGV
jgi:hypothetical protein